MVQVLRSSIKNRILAALPPTEFALLAKDLRRVDLALGETLHQAGQAIDYVYFIESGFISALTVLADGQPLEIGLIGSEARRERWSRSAPRSPTARPCARPAGMHTAFR